MDPYKWFLKFIQIFSCTKVVFIPLYHAVKVVGWNKSSEGIPFWIAKNYFGSDWGENGYFRIRMDDVHTEIGMYVYVASVTYQ